MGETHGESTAGYKDDIPKKKSSGGAALVQPQGITQSLISILR